MGVPVLHGVPFTSWWIGRGNFFTPWGYPLLHGGIRYIVRVPTSTWNVFRYPIRGSTYPIGEKVPFTPVEKNRWYPLPHGVGYTLLHGGGTLPHKVGYTLLHGGSTLPHGVRYTLLYGEGTVPHRVGYILLHGVGTLPHGVGYTLLHGENILPHGVGYSQTQWCEERSTRLTSHTTVK